jgi:hypothetical protein
MLLLANVKREPLDPVWDATHPDEIDDAKF